MLRTERQRHLMRLSGVIGAVLVILMAGFELWAWHTQDETLHTRLPQAFAIMYNSVLMFLLLAIGILLLVCTSLDMAVLFIALAVTGLATLSVLQDLTGLSFGIDQLFMPDWVHPHVDHPGRMTPNSAVAFILSGICMVLSVLEKREHTLRWRTILSDALGFVVFGIGAVALLGHIEGIQAAPDWRALVHMSHQSAFCNILMGLCFLSLGWQRDNEQVSYIPLWTSAFFCLIVLLIDLVTPSGITAGIAYVPLVFCSLWFTQPRTTYLFATIATALSIFGYLSTPQEELIPVISFANRIMSVATIWFIAALVYMLRRHDRILNETDLKLRAAVNYAVDGVVTISSAGNVESFNPACERMFGYSSHEVVGRNIKMLMPEPYHSAHDGYLHNYKQTGNAKIIGTKGRRVSGRRKDGSEFPMDLSVSEFDLPDGRHFCGIVRDITERIDAEKAQEQLRHAQKMESLGQLTGGIAHDFNNLLAVILGNLDFLMEKTKKGDPLRSYIQPCIDASMHGSELTQRLLAFSRKQPLNPKTLDVNDLIQYFTLFVQRLLGERIEVVQKLGPEIWAVCVDTHQLQDALLNLAVNARDAMVDGGKLIIETQNIELDKDYASQHPEVSAGKYVLIAVSDNGSGMNQEALERAFEPFFTTKEVGKGSGLGLSMVYGFVKQSAGHIKLYSEVGHGTTVKIFLPKTDAKPQVQEKLPDMTVEEEKKDKTVLLVEDNEELLKITSTMVESMGYEVITASTGDAAYEILQTRQQVDLLLTDVMLPGVLNGSTLTKAARQIRPDLRVIFISGFAEHAMTQSGLLEEGIPLLSKPFRKVQLAYAIEEVMRSQK